VTPAERGSGSGSSTPQPDASPAPEARRNRFHVIVPIVVAVMSAVTAFVFFVPGFQFVSVSPEADHVVNSAAVLGAGGVAVLAWIRYTQTREPDSLLQASAFLVLFAGGAVSLTLLLTDLDMRTGFDRDAPGQGPLYLWTIQRALAALILLVSAFAALRRVTIDDPRIARAIVVLPTAAALGATVLVLAYAEQLPPLASPERLARVVQPTDVLDRSLLSAPLVVTQLTVAAIYLAAAAAYSRLYDRSYGHRPYIGYLAAGLAIAAFSQVHFAVVPGAYQDLLTSGDVLRVLFYGVVLAGVAAAARGDLVDLRRANETLVSLREADARRVTLEERARLAREIHDGLVQDLWLARLTHGRLANIADLPAEAREVADRVDGMLENALAEARQAIVAMQPQVDSTFGSLLLRFVEDYGDRFGLEVECTVEGEPVRLSGHEQAEVLRICREALNNARKHADASMVRVNLNSGDGTVELRVTDNGRGFDTARRKRNGFGLQSMRERAEALGADLRLESAEMDGTRVTLVLPVPDTVQPQ
jgi:signal transduction histidine kinase